MPIILDSKIIVIVATSVLAYFLGRRIRYWLPVRKEYKIGSFNAVGILIIVYAIDSFLNILSNNYINATCVGLVFGFASNISLDK